MTKKTKNKDKQRPYLNTKSMEEMQWVFDMLGWGKNDRTNRNR